MTFTGERYIPQGGWDTIDMGHMQRYWFVQSHLKDMIVLDAACGEGYGSHLLADVAAHVTGIDVSDETVEHASRKYQKDNLTYIQASIEKLPFDDNSFDAVVSFETIEHVPEQIQKSFLKEVRRVLKKDGIFVISTPNKAIYTEKLKNSPVYHIKEFEHDEFIHFIKTEFEHVKQYSQHFEESCFLHEEGATSFSAQVIASEAREYDEIYMVVVASARELVSWSSSVVMPNDPVRNKRMLLMRSQESMIAKLHDINTDLKAANDDLRNQNTDLAKQYDAIVRSSSWSITRPFRVVKRLLSGAVHASPSIHVPHNNKPRALGVLLCYNDADILKDQIEYLLSQKHDIVVWDHGSDDGTAEVLDQYDSVFVQRKYIPREFDFYNLYPAMSQNLINHFIQDYDMISWPDQDEFLEGPSRDKSYYEYLTDVFNSRYSYIRFDNYLYWYTDEDDASKENVCERIRHYSLQSKCAPRIRAWKAKATNISVFNHNPLEGEQYPDLFKLRHYPFRNKEQLYRRLYKDRADLERDGSNVHYNLILKNLAALEKIRSNMFHIDDGVADLCSFEKFNWDVVYNREGVDLDKIKYVNQP